MAGLVPAIYVLLADVPRERRGCPRRRVPAAWRGGVYLRGHDAGEEFDLVGTGPKPSSSI